MDSLQRAAVWFAAAVVFAGLALSAQATGKWLMQFPFPINRENHPGWFRLGQILLVLLAIGSIGAASTELLWPR